jgi:hypothetical protein
MAWLPVSAPSALTKGSLLQQVPQLFGAAARQRVLDLQRTAQAHDVLGGVVAGGRLFQRGIGVPVIMLFCRGKVLYKTHNLIIFV